MRQKQLKKIAIITAIFLLLVLAFFLLFLNGVFLLNNPSKAEYPVRGVDVSEYQGEIDWEVLAGQELQFAFIKATEGSSYRDPQFAHNWQAAQKSGLAVGAYHFFSFESPGQTQTENFIAAIPKTPGMLPPVVDVEFYGAYKHNLPDVNALQSELNVLLQQLEEYYGQKPILYTTQKAYRYCIEDTFAGYGLWLRSVYTKPKDVPQAELLF